MSTGAFFSQWEMVAANKDKPSTYKSEIGVKTQVKLQLSHKALSPSWHCQKKRREMRQPTEDNFGGFLCLREKPSIHQLSVIFTYNYLQIQQSGMPLTTAFNVHVDIARMANKKSVAILICEYSGANVASETGRAASFSACQQ